ncbi:MAG TPA: GH25 family lysozyme [Pyrinomonadaceae bacterium]|nr:GH25 family lysozyme [Pyrinomonadaceae bacterium]
MQMPATRIKKAFILACLTVILTAGIVFALLYFGILQINNPDKKRFPIRGIDGSHFQQEINWQELKSEDVRFVFIKATEGGDYRDPAFSENWNKSKQAGFVRGAYHFFTFCRTGKEQAQNFINTVPVEAGKLPPVIDLEFGGNCSARPEREILLKELRDFIAEIEGVYNRQPILYLKYDSYETYIKGEFENLHLWIQDRLFYPELSDKRKWTFWQYSSRGRLDGIETYVDLNVFNGTEQDFNLLIESPDKSCASSPCNVNATKRY